MTALNQIIAGVIVGFALAGASIASISSAQAGGYGYGGYSAPVYQPTCHFEYRTDYYGNSIQVKVCH